MNADIQIRPQDRKSLALKVTPAGIQLLIPRHLSADSPEVTDFVEHSLQDLTPPDPVPAADRLDRSAVLDLVADWAGRLGVQVNRIQFQPMRAKWASVSTAGNLTLSHTMLQLPRHLIDYIICHELLHLKVPNHNRLYHLQLSHHLPDWRGRERELARWTLSHSHRQP